MRRTLIKLAGGLPADVDRPPIAQPYRRVGPAMPAGRRPPQWKDLDTQARRPAGRGAARRSTPAARRRTAPMRRRLPRLKNPWAIGDSVALTQTSGWADAWTSTPSAYAVAGARRGRRGGGGQLRAHPSPAAGGERRRPLLPGHVERARIRCWSGRAPMNRIELHDAFVGQGCSDRPQPAVSLGAGVVWLQAYAAVTKAGRYVQGGGCTTVGVAGLIQSGGFGSFSKRYGLAAASLLEAEVVTADGAVRIANACTNPDLFWAPEGRRRRQLRRDHAAHAAGRTSCRRSSARVFVHGEGQVGRRLSRLIERFVAFYREQPVQPDTGASRSRSGRTTCSRSAMVFQGLDQARCRRRVAAVLRLDRRAGAATMRSCSRRSSSHALPARSLWDAAFLKQNAPQMRAVATNGPAPRRPTCSGAPTSARPAGSCTPTNRPGCRRRCSSPTTSAAA